SPRSYRESDIGVRLRHQCATHDHAYLRFRRNARRLCGRDGGADLQRISADGLGVDHRGFRSGGDRRYGVNSRGDHHRFWSWRNLRSDQGVLPRSVEYGDLRHYGDRAAGAACRSVRTESVMERVVDPLAKKPSALRTQSETIGFVIMVAALVIAPFVTYPLFLMQAMCFALFAC